jgi:hypothetical protein
VRRSESPSALDPLEAVHEKPMTKTTNPLRLALEDALGPAGFQRKGDSWFRRTDEVVEIVNLQKSQYGPLYYLNYALWLRALGEEQFPREERCHVRMRADNIVSSEAQLARLLDLRSDLGESERRLGVAGCSPMSSCRLQAPVER